MNEKSIIGAIIGDIAGSRFEWNNYKSTDFPFFTTANKFTDDTVMTIAVADWLLHEGVLANTMHDWAAKYPRRGYGSQFWQWLFIWKKQRTIQQLREWKWNAGQPMRILCKNAE